MLVGNHKECKDTDKVEFLRQVEKKPSIFRVEEKIKQKNSQESDFFPTPEEEKNCNQVQKLFLKIAFLLFFNYIFIVAYLDEFS